MKKKSDERKVIDSSDSVLNIQCDDSVLFNPIVLTNAKIAYNFGLSECNGVKIH